MVFRPSRIALTISDENRIGLSRALAAPLAGFVTLSASIMASPSRAYLFHTLVQYNESPYYPNTKHDNGNLHR